MEPRDTERTMKEQGLIVPLVSSLVLFGKIPQRSGSVP
jgi:hypothetical protein